MKIDSSGVVQLVSLPQLTFLSAKTYVSVSLVFRLSLRKNKVPKWLWQNFALVYSIKPMIFIQLDQQIGKKMKKQLQNALFLWWSSSSKKLCLNICCFLTLSDKDLLKLILK